MRDLTTSIDIEKILLAALLKGTLNVVADGSAPSAGGFAWVLAAYEDPLHLIHGGGYTGPTIWHHITPHGSLRLPRRTFRYRPIDQDSSPGMDPNRNQAIAHHPLLLR
jgi:hypothetical protein